jgi:hypothetical protein
MELSTYEARRSELDAQMQKLNEMESEKKMELSIKYQADCKKIQSQIGNLKKKQNDTLKQYQNDKAWWHAKFKSEKQDITSKMHLLRLEYLTVNNIQCKENGGTK